MSAASLDSIPYITISKSGVAYRIPVQQVPQRDGSPRPVPVSRNPKISFPQPIAIGEGSVRRNYDIDEFIVTTWQGGMGEDTYAAATNPSSYQVSDCDTRYPGVLVCRQSVTQLGAAVTAGGQAHRILESGYTNATHIWWQQGLVGAEAFTARRLSSGGAWTAITNGGNNLRFTSLERGLNGLLACAQVVAVGYDIYRTVDGVTWDKMARGAMSNPYLIAEFDNRAWVLDRIATAGAAGHLVYTVYASTDLVSAAAGAGTWTAGNNFATPANENALRLFVWVYPPDKGRSTLWCLTNARLFYYDYYAATPSWVPWTTYGAAPQAATYGGWCEVYPANNNLYVLDPDISGRVWEFTGATITPFSPNKRGGLPAGSKLLPVTLAGTARDLGVFCSAPASDSGGFGLATLFREGGTFHPLYRHASQALVGGGLGVASAYAVTSDGTQLRVWQQGNPIDDDLPQHASGRTYDSAALDLVTGWINIGLKNVNKRVLYAELDAIRAGGGTGLETGATLQVFVGLRVAPPGTLLELNLGTLTDASTFPAVLAISGGLPCKEFYVRLRLTRGTATSASPFLRALKVGLRPQPKQRYTYSVRVDVRDEAPAFQTADGKFAGYTASFLRGFLDELSDHDDLGQPDPLVGLAYGGKGNSLHPRYRSMPQCEVLVQSQESTDKADGLALLTFSDVSAPTSG